MAFIDAAAPLQHLTSDRALLDRVLTRVTSHMDIRIHRRIASRPACFYHGGLGSNSPQNAGINTGRKGLNHA